MKEDIVLPALLPAKEERFKLFGSTEPMNNRPRSKPVLKEEMVDHQNKKGDYFFPLDAVGVQNVKYPIFIESTLDPEFQPTTGTFTLTTHQDKEARGIHMSRLTETLHGFYENKTCTLRSLKVFSLLLAKKLEQNETHIKVEYPWFYKKASPVERAEGMAYAHIQNDIHFQRNHSYRYSFAMEATVASLCPCSKDISEYGAHNQRSYIKVSIDVEEDDLDLDWKQVLLEAIESSASTILYPVLKRPDEKKVTENAYANPRFVEDLARLVAGELYEHGNIPSFTVECRNEESIHQHDAIARICYPTRKKTSP
jgi:GTP cyclohydrolase IB